MVLRVLGIELRRAFTSAGFAAASLFMFVLAIYAFCRNVVPYINVLGYFDSLLQKEGALNYAPDWLWGSWLGSNIGFEGFLYLLLLPLLTGLPYAATLLADRKSGYSDLVSMKAGRSAYYGAKWCTAFISGAVVAMIPLVINFALCLLVYPPVTPQLGGQFAIDPVNMLSSLYSVHPWVWLGTWTVIFACVGGVYAMLGLAVTYLTEFSLVVHLLPFLVIYVASMLFSSFGYERYSLLSELRVMGNGGNAAALVAEIAILAAVAVVPMYLFRRRDCR